MAEKEADLLVDEEDQATDAPELAIAQKKRALGTYVGAFFDELMRAGVRDVVVSPGLALHSSFDGCPRGACAIRIGIQPVS